MSYMTWIVLIVAVLLIGGLISGAAGLLLAPLVGIVVLIALVVWLLKRRAQGKPPVE